MKRSKLLTLALVLSVMARGICAMEGEPPEAEETEKEARAKIEAEGKGLELQQLPAEVLAEIFEDLPVEQRMQHVITILGKEGLFEEPEEGRPRITAPYAGLARAMRRPLLDTKLVDAVTAGNEEEVKQLIKEGADVNFQTEQGATPLMLAVGKRKADIFEVLLKAGADVNVQDEEGETALTYLVGAAFFGFAPGEEGPLPKMLWALLRHPELDLTGEQGVQALRSAVATTKIKVIEELFERGVDPRKPHPRIEESLLEVATRLKNFYGGAYDNILTLIEGRIKELEAKETPQIEMGPAGKEEL